MKRLDLETCRKLKEAGFPQGTNWQYAVHDGADVHEMYSEDEMSWMHSEYSSGFSDMVACPGADELLEALPTSIRQDDGRYFKLTIEWNGCWTAFYGYIGTDECENLSIGDTPAEALAALYLSLNAPKE